MTYDLTKTEDRMKALKQLNEAFKSALKDAGVKLHEDALVSVNSSHIEISIKDVDPKSSYFGLHAFASGVTINCDELSGFRKGNNKISISGVAAFDPTTNYIQMWRTIHMCSLIENWDKVSKLTTEYCLKYNSVCDEIRIANKLR